MQINPTAFPGVFLLTPTVHRDARGSFTETFRLEDLENQLGRSIQFVQDNESLSYKGVIRGLHYQQPPFAQSKLVRVVQGEVWDVIVDLRQDSPTFGQFYSETLSSENQRQLFIPRGFAHGYITLSDTAIFAYKVDQYYSKAHEASIAFDDPQLGIPWPLDPQTWILSDKDRKHPGFAAAPRFKSLNNADD
jgi:dTDP-4-dehydrorhamnose 3,5-epimerase